MRTCVARDSRRVCGLEDDFLEDGRDRERGEDLEVPLFNGRSGVEFLDMSSSTCDPTRH